MSQIRDLFFDEFYTELERVAFGLSQEQTPIEPLLLRGQLEQNWHSYVPDADDRHEALISVDGGVQMSIFAYGDMVVVARSCALVHWPERDPFMEKTVKIHVDQVFDQRDRGFIPGYVRMISEYDAAYNAAKRVLDDGGSPVVVMDGALYFSRFPYAMREYQHHGELLAELFNSLTRLRCLARDHSFPLIGVAKDSTVFYLYMTLLQKLVHEAGLGRLSGEVDASSSPIDLRMKVERWPIEDKTRLEPFIEKRPLCDTALVKELTDGEGYTQPLLLAPSIYFGRNSNTPSLFGRIDRTLGTERARPIIKALDGFFKCPGIATTYWKPRGERRPFRVDVAASWLGYDESWQGKARNRLVDMGCDLRPLEKVFNHLGYWFVNAIEYNIPLRQADLLAHFDRQLYRQKYEPFIVKRLEDAGLMITGTRRDIREIDG